MQRKSITTRIMAASKALYFEHALENWIRCSYMEITGKTSYISIVFSKARYVDIIVGDMLTVDVILETRKIYIFF